jgi:NitT/TauT family transport system substrate-binding protein
MPKALLTFITLIALASGIITGCSGGPGGQMDSITFGTTPTGTAVSIYLAQDQHYFASNGLTVDVKDYPTGVAATEALLKGEVDIALSAEFPMVAKAFEEHKLSIVAVLHRFSSQYLFGRRDRGIEKIADLKGKKIGVARNTISEFYLARFLSPTCA